MDARLPPLFNFDSPLRQHFAIPQNIIYYLTKNPTSALGWKKLLKTCKYFYSKNPIVVVDELYSGHNQALIIYNRLPNRCIKEKKEIDLKTIEYRFWVTNSITLYQSNNCEFIRNIYSLNIFELRITRETISYEDLYFLAFYKCIKKIVFNCADFKNKDGSVVEFDKILKLFPKIKVFYYNESENIILSKDVIYRINKLPCFENLKYFSYCDISYELDIEAFSFFMKKSKQTEFYLHFTNNISRNYAVQLQTFADTIVKEGENYSMHIAIKFPGINNKTLINMSNLSFKLSMAKKRMKS